MLEANQITKSYGNLQVLRGVSLTVKPHEIVSVVGASGAGKTTLLQILGSLILPDSGSVTIHGMDLFAMREKELSRFRNKQIGFVQWPARCLCNRVLRTAAGQVAFSVRDVDCPPPESHQMADQLLPIDT